MNQQTKVQIYFYSILVISIIWLLGFPKPIKNFAPIIFVIPTFPVFVFRFYDMLEDFSRVLKKTLPDLFQKHVVDYGISVNRDEIVDVGLFVKNEDFGSLEDVGLYEMYFLCKQSIKLAFLSFFIFGLLGIATVYL